MVLFNETTALVIAMIIFKAVRDVVALYLDTATGNLANACFVIV